MMIAYFLFFILQSVEIHFAHSLDVKENSLEEYSLFFNTHHFEWSKAHFTPDSSSSACTQSLPSLCVHFTPNKPGFSVSYNRTAYDFGNDDDWMQIHYLHRNDSAVLYGGDYQRHLFLRRPRTHHRDDLLAAAAADASKDQSEDDDSDAEDEMFRGRRLLGSSGGCRVYLYSGERFQGRIGSPVRNGRYSSNRALKDIGYDGSPVRSVKVRGSRCCRAKLYARSRYGGRRVRFRRGRYSRIRRERHKIPRLGSMKVYCSRSGGEGRRSRGRGVGGLAGLLGGLGRGAMHHLNREPHPIPILLGPLSGMLGHYGYSMHPMVPPHMAAMAGMYGGSGRGGLMGLPMMSHPMFGHPTIGHPMHGMGMGMGMGRGMMNPMMGMMGGGMGMMHPMTMMGGGMMHPMMSGMGMGMGMMHPHAMMGGYGGDGGKTPVVHVYPDEEQHHVDQHRRRRRLQSAHSPHDIACGALKKCVVLTGAELCATYYVADGVVSLDYTEMAKKVLPVHGESTHLQQQDELDEDVMWMLASGDDHDQNEDYNERLMQHEDYQQWRDAKIFKLSTTHNANANRVQLNGVHHVDRVHTVSWMWNGQTACNARDFAFAHIAICTMPIKSIENPTQNDILIYAKYIGAEMEEHYLDYFDLEDWKLKIRDLSAWHELYQINMNDQNRTNQKLCKNIAMFKLCVEVMNDKFVAGHIDEMQISVQFV